MSWQESVKEERRRSPRIETDLSVGIRMSGSGQIQRSVIKNLSSTGLRVISSDFLPSQTPILIELGLKELPQILNISGKTIWVKNLNFSERYQMGVEFRDVDKKTKSVLEEYTHLKSRLLT